MIKGFGMSVCRADSPGLDVEYPKSQPFEYVRRHGPIHDVPYIACYTDAQIKADAKMIRGWKRSRKKVFVYYNNDSFGYAIKNALRLKQLIK